MVCHVDADITMKAATQRQRRRLRRRCGPHNFATHILRGKEETEPALIHLAAFELAATKPASVLSPELDGSTGYNHWSRSTGGMKGSCILASKYKYISRGNGATIIP